MPPLSNVITRPTEDVDVIIFDMMGSSEETSLIFNTPLADKIRRIIKRIGKRHGLKGQQQLFFNDDCSPFLLELSEEEQRGWATFCAGSAEYLAERYGLRCPEWAHNSAYCMKEPWYIIPNASLAMRKHFHKTTPEAFRRRNVFCDDHVFSNAHSSSREPGNLADVRQKRREVLASLPSQEREAYLLTHAKKMVGKPRIHIVP